MEKIEGKPGEPYNPILRTSKEVNKYIRRNYKSPKPPRQGRTDAMIFAASHLAISKIEPFFHPEEKEYNNNDAIKADWAIEQGKIGNWQPMKEFLQELGHVFMNASSEIFPNFPAEIEQDLEQQGQSLFYLANSLGV